MLLSGEPQWAGSYVFINVFFPREPIVWRSALLKRVCEQAEFVLRYFKNTARGIHLCMHRKWHRSGAFSKVSRFRFAPVGRFNGSAGDPVFVYNWRSMGSTQGSASASFIAAKLNLWP